MENKKIKVLGSGCKTCHKLFELTKEVLLDLGYKNEVEYITDIRQIVERGIISSPVLLIDENPVVAGFLPDREKLKQIINDNFNL